MRERHNIRLYFGFSHIVAAIKHVTPLKGFGQQFKFKYQEPKDEKIQGERQTYNY